MTLWIMFFGLYMCFQMKKMRSSKQSYHACWWPRDGGIQGPSGCAIDLVHLEYSRLCTRKGKLVWRLICPWSFSLKWRISSLVASELVKWILLVSPVKKFHHNEDFFVLAHHAFISVSLISVNIYCVFMQYIGKWSYENIWGPFD